jgi:hypothetical protein
MDEGEKGEKRERENGWVIGEIEPHGDLFLRTVS